MKNVRKLLITFFFGICFFLINDTTVLANCGHGAYVYDGGDVPYDCYTAGGHWERCRVCGDRKWKTLKGSHDWSLDYHSIDDDRHGKQCKKRYLGWPEGTRRCPEMRYQNHSKTGYYSDGQGNYVNRCTGCNWIKSEYITYSIAFNSNYPNGSRGNGQVMGNQSFTYATAQNLNANRYGYDFSIYLDTNKGIYDSVPQLNSSSTITGHSRFLGWATSSGGNKVYDDKQSVINLTVNQYDVINLYAKWGGANLNLPSPSRPGFDFSGWYTAASGGTSVGNGSSYMPSGDTTLYAHWTDNYAPSTGISIDPRNTWISGNGTVTVTAQDSGTGLASIEIKRKNVNTGAVVTVATYSCNGTTAAVTKTYTETSEGVFEYTCEAKDRSGNVGRSSAGQLKIDHSNPVIRGLESINTNWTNIAPSIAITTTDYLQGTSYTGSGVGRVEISDHNGTVVVSGTSAATYVVPASYEGEWIWNIKIVDNVGHVTTGSITTRYDITGPDISGTDADVLQDGIHYSGYCEDNIIDQQIWDDPSLSVNLPNVSSGIRNVMFYKVDDNGTKTPLHAYAVTFGTPDMNNSHSIYYDAEEEGDQQESYEIVAEDFAGNITRKRLVTQQSILSRFRTSIDRSSYE